jgi:hypothetical protein
MVHEHDEVKNVFYKTSITKGSWLFGVLVDIAGDGNVPLFACDSLTFG